MFRRIIMSCVIATALIASTVPASAYYGYRVGPRGATFYGRGYGYGPRAFYGRPYYGRPYYGGAYYGASPYYSTPYYGTPYYGGYGANYGANGAGFYYY